MSTRLLLGAGTQVCAELYVYFYTDKATEVGATFYLHVCPRLGSLFISQIIKCRTCQIKQCMSRFLCLYKLMCKMTLAKKGKQPKFMACLGLGCSNTARTSLCEFTAALL